MQISPLDTTRDTVRQAVEILNSGGLVVLPTETVYGIAASAASERGLEALRAFKGRPVNQPFTIHLPDPTAAERYIGTAHPTVQRLIRKTFPGPITLVVDVTESTINRQVAGMNLPAHARPWLFHQHTVGLRCPDSPITREILGAVESPVIASSANARGQAPPHDAQQASRAVGHAAQLVVDGGRCRFGKPSTVVRITQTAGPPSVHVERAGVYDERYIRKLTRWTMVLVCSGNTCRSPMAETIAKRVLAEKLDLAIDDLESANISVQSAGVFAHTGLPASADAAQEMLRQGMDLSGHRSRPLTRQLVQQADVCYCMTAVHQRAVLEMVPEAADRILPLDPAGDVEDPIGSGPAGYRRCADVIRNQLVQRLKEHYP